MKKFTLFNIKGIFIFDYTSFSLLMNIITHHFESIYIIKMF